jgi:Putative transposase
VDTSGAAIVAAPRSIPTIPARTGVVPNAILIRRSVGSPHGGEGDEAVLRYLARYVFRVATTNSLIVGVDANGVTLRHKHRASNRWRTIHLTGHEFIRRFLQHVLPKGLHKVRYYGLWHPTRREHAAQARLLLLLQRPASSELEAPPSPTPSDIPNRPDNPTPPGEPHICPHCKDGHLIHVGRLYPKQPSGP